MSGEGSIGPPGSGAPRAQEVSGSPAPLSVVVPTHDTRELTLRCLASLASARPAPAEVIVVDDGSRDGTAEAVAASYPAARLLRHPEARGFTAAANAGAALSGSDFLLLLNSDTEVAVGALGALVAAFAGAPSLGVAGATLRYPDDRPQWSGGRTPDALWLFALASGLAFRLGRLRAWRWRRAVSGHGDSGASRVEWVTGAALATRRVVWAEVGPLDPRFALYAQDLDFCLRARDAGWEVAVVPECRVVHHHGATVGAGGGVGAARHNAGLLWADLVRWVGKRRGPAAARRAAGILSAGGAVQRLLLAAEGAIGGAPADAREKRRMLREAAAAARAAAADGPAAALPTTAERSTTP
jgi:GT2 family glycosyltransferase